MNPTLETLLDELEAQERARDLWRLRAVQSGANIHELRYFSLKTSRHWLAQAIKEVERE